MQSQGTALMEIPKLQELLWHCVDPRQRQHIVVIVVTDRLLVEAQCKRPEPERCHFVTQPQRQAHKEEACGKASAMYAMVLPEAPHILQKVWIGEQHCLVGP